MSDVERFAMLLTRTGVSLPRGVLDAAARAYAEAILSEAPADELVPLRAATAEAHWDGLRLAMGAALERAGAPEADPTLADALELTLDERPGNDLALALAEVAARALAAALERTAERLGVLELRLSGHGAEDADTALVVGGIVADLLDLDPADYDEEIAAFIGAGENEAARAELARSTGDPEVRKWARATLREVGGDDSPSATAALWAIAAGDPPDDPAADAVWVATILSLVEDAVEYAMITGGDGEG